MQTDKQAAAELMRHLASLIEAKSPTDEESCPDVKKKKPKQIDCESADFKSKIDMLVDELEVLRDLPKRHDVSAYLRKLAIEVER